MALNVTATITDSGKRRISEAMRTGKSFVVDAFSVTDGGHSPSDPLVALAANPEAITCPEGTTSFGPVPINASTQISAFCPQFTCVLDYGDANGPFSSVCLWATFNYSPVLGDPDVGQSFLFAVANMPLNVKTAASQVIINVTIQL